MLKTFEELEVYKMCREFRQEIANLAKTLPQNESHKLVSQLLRSSRNITSNIAEGFGRFHHLENIQFCRQSRGSLMETLEHLIIACDEGYLDPVTLDEFRGKQSECIKMINAYISYLKKTKNRAFESAPTTPYLQEQF